MRTTTMGKQPAPPSKEHCIGFLERACYLSSTLIADEARMAAYVSQHPSQHPSQYVHAYTFPKENGAVRRASMDLTRALAKMRGAK